ncbi:hypothetical protein [Aeromicrobium sp. JJY06]|uniref:hypothetical protein n=1 Tax=Aeromicrobium sp. JJY06 TaxID=3373478 RepID=UPI00376EF41A
MDLSSIFASTVEDLRNRSRYTASEYDAVQASGLLRRLLIDGTAIAPQAVKALGLDHPKYEWASVYMGEVSGALLDANLFRSVGRALFERDPTISVAIRTGDQAEFLAWEVSSRSPDGSVTVKDLIRHYAVVEGGVHYGQAWNRVPARLQTLLSHPAYAPRLRETLAAVGRIVASALSGPAMIAAHPELRASVERAAASMPDAAANAGKATPNRTEA